MKDICTGSSNIELLKMALKVLELAAKGLAIVKDNASQHKHSSRDVAPQVLCAHP